MDEGQDTDVLKEGSLQEIQLAAGSKVSIEAQILSVDSFALRVIVVPYVADALEVLEIEHVVHFQRSCALVESQASCQAKLELHPVFIDVLDESGEELRSMESAVSEVGGELS